MSNRYTVNIYINCGPDNFFGYTPEAPLAWVGGVFTVEADEPQHAAEAAFRVGQKEFGGDANGKAYPPDVRSVSVGDVIMVTGGGHPPAYLAVASVGFDELDTLPNPGIELADAGHNVAAARRRS